MATIYNVTLRGGFQSISVIIKCPWFNVADVISMLDDPTS